MQLDTFFSIFFIIPFGTLHQLITKQISKTEKKLLYWLVLHNYKTLKKTANCNTVYMICDKLQLLVLFEMHTVSILISLKQQVAFNLNIIITL